MSLDLLHLLSTLPLEVLRMPLEAGEDGRPVEVVGEEIYLPLIGKIIASGIEAEDVYPRHGDVVQVLVEALLRSQFTTEWEMIVELISFHELISVLVTICVLPLNIPKIAASIDVLDPTFSESSSLHIVVS